ncbi:hypothetical protein EIL87_07365 [Saccharopolyspora rhizosphaerae]|uniref:DUF4878 domain-containing protein n=1 Tax=Saccharopolyspora rhizosphaerae TaxID=2492662 RepID=A0A426JYE3_9PSEU|nr:hypothetical protein [Saccharopolyspora rhizosphaerae]RRO18071.1 hypothetical protein EIL87_07365 [Saccharopolyspora rhizosphaerae]
MTYPPQQPPGQGGWGQQPGGQHPQQPGGPFPPSGGQPYPQPGGAQPPTGGQQYPQPGYPQQPQAGYPQQPFPNPYGGYGPPPKKKSPLPWILGGVGGLVVLGAIIALVVAFTGGPGDPRPVAQQAVDMMNAKDFAGVQSITCDRASTKVQDMVDMMEGKGSQFDELESMGVPKAEIQKMVESLEVKFTLGEVTDNGDNTATAHFNGTMSLHMDVMGQRMDQDVPINETNDLIVEDGEWKLC